MFARRGILGSVKQDVKFNHASSVSGLEVGRKLGCSSLASKVPMLRLKFRYAYARGKLSTKIPYVAVVANRVPRKCRKHGVRILRLACVGSINRALRK